LGKARRRLVHRLRDSQHNAGLLPDRAYGNKPIAPSILPTIPGINLSLWSPLSTLIFFLYWTFSEWYFGRSIGQLLLNLRLVDLHGRPPNLKASAIQSVGKTLLLPLDCLVGWASKSCRKRRQRFFNELSHTIVIFIGISNKIIQQGEYSKEP
jgi:hypothetical protein